MLEQTYGAKVSHETVANITDSVNELVKAWRSGRWTRSTRSSTSTRSGFGSATAGRCGSRPCQLAVGVNLESRKRVLGTCN